MNKHWTDLFRRRGFQTRLAKRFSLPKQTVNRWPKFGIPPAYCIGVEEECGGEFSRLDFRPDDGARIWPDFAKEQAERIADSAMEMA